MSHFPSGTAAHMALASCHVCRSLQAVDKGERCQVCSHPIHLRKPYAIQRCVAYLVTAIVLYIPANLLPIMKTEQLGHVTDSTIMGGVILLIHHGSYPIAFIIFIASIVVPVLKIIAIATLCWAAASNRNIDPHRLTRLYTITELIGKWSMVDVFVVALLVALIQVGSLMSIRPGSAALAFAGVVVMTIMAARSFDPRIIWDKEAKQK